MRRFRLGLILFAIAASGCSSPGAPPNPPAEIPSLIVFPPSVTIDVGTISSVALEITALVGSGGEFSDAIVIGGDTARIIQEEVLEGLLFPFSAFEIPVNPATKAFSGTLPGEEGSLPQSFKFDFADFDFDGNGAKEGCSGCTCPAGCGTESCPSEVPQTELKPVCFRAWIQRDPTQPFERVMAGFFESLPIRDDPSTPGDEENPGKGRFHAGVVKAGSFEGSFVTERFLVGVIYDHRVPDRPSDKSTEAFLVNDFVQDGTLIVGNSAHIQVSQIGKTDAGGKDYAKKSVKSADQSVSMGAEGDNDFSQRYIGGFRDDADFWSGSLFATDRGVVTRDIPTTCAQISTGDGAAAADCNDLGIDTTGEAFIDLATDADVVFPSDFPASPPL